MDSEIIYQDDEITVTRHELMLPIDTWLRMNPEKYELFVKKQDKILPAFFANNEKQRLRYDKRIKADEQRRAAIRKAELESDERYIELTDFEKQLYHALKDKLSFEAEYEDHAVKLVRVYFNGLIIDRF